MKFRHLATSLALFVGGISLYWAFSSSTDSMNAVVTQPPESAHTKNLQEFPVVPGKCRPGGISPFATDSSTCDVNASQAHTTIQTASDSSVLLVKGQDVRKVISTLQSGTKDTNFIYGELLDECLNPEAVNGADREGCAELLKHRGSWLGKLKVATHSGNETAGVLLAKELQLLAFDSLAYGNKVKK